MSFLAKFGLQALSDIADEGIKLVVSGLPETASKAQIAMYKDRVAEIEKAAAAAFVTAEDDENKANELKAQYERYKAATLSLGADAKADPSLTKDFEAAAAKTKKLKAEYEAAAERAANSKTYFEQCKAAHEQGVEQLLTIEQRLEDKKREADQARLDAERAEQQKRQQEKLAGLTKGLDTMDTVIDAMDANIKKDKQRAAGAHMTANALAKSGAGGESDALKAALAKVDGKAPAGGKSIDDLMADL